MRLRRAALTVLPAVLFCLAGCSLVESVIVIEPRGTAPRKAEARSPMHAKASYAANTPKSGDTTCEDVFGDGTTTCSDLAKAGSARYDETRLEKPPEKPARKKTETEGSGSELSRLFKRWVMTGMRLNSWSNAE